MATNDYSESELGPWTGDNFEATAAQYGAITADADFPDEDRFVDKVAKLLLRRKAEADNAGESDDGDIAIFVLEPKPPESLSDAERVPMFDNGLTMVTGRLWFTPPAVVMAHYVDLPHGANDDTRFSFVADELDLGSLPTLLFDPRTSSPELRWYPNGLSEPDNVELKPLGGDVTPDEVFEVIDRLHAKCFITPSGLPTSVNFWNDSGSYRPRENAEALVQSYLKIGLTSAFPFCTVRHEQTQTAGRTDLEIEQLNPIDGTIATRHAIIELKVLRSYGSGGSTVSPATTNDAIEKGVRQASAYRLTKETRWSALCCFDMRKDDLGVDACFHHVQELATELAVTLKRWFLYASSDAYRQALTNSKLHS